jgi:ribonucleotide monophosphatase NagD (HAD superfamily)
VTWIGKPFPEIYTAALQAVGDPVLERVVGIGDSVEHDIAGARSAGARSALVRTGVLTNLSDQEIDQLEQRYDAVADYVLASFRWRSGS